MTVCCPPRVVFPVAGRPGGSDRLPRPGAHASGAASDRRRTPQPAPARTDTPPPPTATSRPSPTPAPTETPLPPTATPPPPTETPLPPTATPRRLKRRRWSRPRKRRLLRLRSRALAQRAQRSWHRLSRCRRIEAGRRRGSHWAVRRLRLAPGHLSEGAHRVDRWWGRLCLVERRLRLPAEAKRPPADAGANPT